MADPLERLAFQLFLNQTTWLEANEAQLELFEQRGDVAQAVRAALARQQEQPFDPAGYLKAGSVLMQNGRYGEALAAFVRANAVAETGIGRSMEGALLLNAGDAAGAAEALARAVALSPADLQARYNLAGAYALVGKIAEARAALAVVLQQQPDHPGALQLLAQLK